MCSHSGDGGGDGVVVRQLAPPRACAALADAHRVGAARVREEREREEDVEERVRELEAHEEFAQPVAGRFDSKRTAAERKKTDEV